MKKIKNYMRNKLSSWIARNLEILPDDFDFFPRYDPSRISDYKDTTFITSSDSRYTVDKNGRFYGRPSIAGGKVALIAGVSSEYSGNISSCLGTPNYSPEKLRNLRMILDNKIREHGQEPKEGLHLVISLNQDSAWDLNRVGFISSPIKRIVRRQ